MASYRTREELYDKVLEAREQIEDNTFRRSSPTVKEYCEKWLLLQSAQVATTLTDYTSKVNRHIIKPLGHMNIADVTAGYSSGTGSGIQKISVCVQIGQYTL